MNKLIIQRNQDVGGTQTGIQRLTHELTLLHPDWILRLKTKRTVYKCCVSFFFFLPVLGNLHDLNLSTRDQTQALGSESWKPGVLTTGQPGNSLTGFFFSFFFKWCLFIYFWLCRVFVAVRGFSLVAFLRLLIAVASRGLPWWLKQLRTCLPCRRPRFNPWVRKIPWRREWQSIPVFLPGEFHG